jgi:hypothetical protein
MVRKVADTMTLPSQFTLVDTEIASDLFQEHEECEDRIVTFQAPWDCGLWRCLLGVYRRVD